MEENLGTQFDSGQSHMTRKAISRKIRRESGRRYVSYGDEYDYYWSNWYDYRDGYRDHSDKSKIIMKSKARKQIPEKYSFKSPTGFYFGLDDYLFKVHKNNEKLKRLLKRRKAMKETRK